MTSRLTSPPRELDLVWLGSLFDTEPDREPAPALLADIAAALVEGDRVAVLPHPVPARIRTLRIIGYAVALRS